MFRNSGKGVNDFGRFKDCEAMPDFNYMLAQISSTKKLSNPLSIGFCMPTVCKESDLNALKPLLIPTLNNELKWIFEDVKGLNLTQLQLEPEDIELVSSLELNRNATQFDRYNFLFTLIMLVIIAFSIAGSVITHQKYKIRKQEIMERRKRMKSLP